MKHLKTLLFGLLVAGCVSSATAQCSPPGAVTTSLTNIVCRGSGQVAVTGVTDTSGMAINTDSCNYSLYNASNTVLVRPEQSSPIFNGLDSGTYNLHVRHLCANPTGVSDYYNKQVVLTGFYKDPVMGLPVASNPTSSCSFNGKITAATVTNGVPPYTYCLVDSMNAPLLPSHYVASPQSSPVFNGLNSGIYYLRMYDACGASLIRQITLTAPVQPVLGAVSLVRINCDTVEMRATVFPYTVSNPQQRTWVTYPNGTTDTLNVIINNGSYIPYRVAWSAITGDSATLILGFKDICGQVQTEAKILKRPDFYMAPSFGTYAYDCTSGYFVPGIFQSGSATMGLLDSNNSNYAAAEKYYYQYYSTDSGATWKPYNINDTVFLANGTSIQLQFKWCNQVYTTVLSATAPVLSANIWVFNKLACTGKSGFYIHKPYGYTGSIDSVLVEITARPLGQDSIPPFYNNWSHLQGANPQLYNLVPGTYTVRLSDRCNSFTKTIAIAANPYSAAVVKPRFNCTNTINLYLADTTSFTNVSLTSWWRRYFAVYNSAGVNVYNYSYPYANEGYTIGTWSPDLPPDTYTIRTWKGGGNGIGSSAAAVAYTTDTVCGADTIVIDAHMPAPLSMKNVLFTTCSNDSLLGSVIAIPTGGIGAYNYSIFHDSVSAATLVAGPQASNVFNNLTPGTIYVISAMDQCGSSTPAQSALSNTRPITTPSTNRQPCINDAISLSVDSVAGLTYQWTLNGATIPGATHPAYSISSMTLADSGIYVANINTGNCLLLASPVTLDPSQCGNIILPLDLLRFSGSVNAQRNALLHWDIARAEAGSTFEILYSTDGSRFMTAGTVLQDGISTAFSFVHKDYKINARTFYRLRIINEAGQQQYSNIIALNGGTTAANHLSAAPVPFSNVLYVNYTAARDAAVIFTVLDISGRTVRSLHTTVNAGINNIRIGDLDALPSGNYLLTVAGEDGNRQTLKIQK